MKSEHKCSCEARCTNWPQPRAGSDLSQGAGYAAQIDAWRWMLTFKNVFNLKREETDTCYNMDDPWQHIGGTCWDQKERCLLCDHHGTRWGEGQRQLTFKRVQEVSFALSSGAGWDTLAQNMNTVKIIQRVTPPPRTPHHLSKLQPSMCSTTKYIHNPESFVFYFEHKHKTDGCVEQLNYDTFL